MKFIELILNQSVCFHSLENLEYFQFYLDPSEEDGTYMTSIKFKNEDAITGTLDLKFLAEFERFLKNELNTIVLDYDYILD